MQAFMNILSFDKPVRKYVNNPFITTMPKKTHEEYIGS